MCARYQGHRSVRLSPMVKLWLMAEGAHTLLGRDFGLSLTAEVTDMHHHDCLTYSEKNLLIFLSTVCTEARQGTMKMPSDGQSSELILCPLQSFSLHTNLLTRLLEMEEEAESGGRREDAAHSRVPVSFIATTV